MRHLEIGGGSNYDGEFNLDPVHGTGEYKQRIQDWTPNSKFDTARASHVMEHIPAADRVVAMNTIHSALVSGGTFEIIVPLVGAYGRLIDNYRAWADPTHVSYWWMPESFEYFTGQVGADADYGIYLWSLVEQEVRDSWEGRCVLMKP